MRSPETDPTSERARRVLVIGYGNALRGDDGLGQVIAERIAGTVRPDAIDTIVAHQLTPELAEPVSRADLVIFIDAGVGVPPGRIKITSIVAAAEPPGALGHSCGPARLLAVAQNLYGHHPETWVISVGGTRWDQAEALSPVVERLVPRVLRYIELLITVRLPAETSHA